MVPLIYTRSPGLAPARRTIAPWGTLPIMAIEIVTGPGVRSVSPPNSGQPNSAASARSPSANRSSHSSAVSVGSARESRKPRGRAPFAARSDRFTRSALRATSCAESSGKKCTPPTMASVLSTRSHPGGGLRKAASSESPSAPGCVASGLKKRAIRRSSADILSPAVIISPRGAVELTAAQASRELVEHSVDHSCLVPLDESSGNVGIFGYDNACRNIEAVGQLIGAGPQSRAQNRFDALKRPAFRQRLIDQGIEISLFAHHARYNVAKERRLSRKILRALDLAAHPVALEFGKDFVEAAAGQIHLIERLHGGKSGSAPLIRLAGILIVACGPGAHHRHTSVCLSATMVNAARAATPPLSPSSARARACACASLSTVRMPLPTARRSFTARSISARADSFATISKWWVSPRMTQPSATTPS